MGTGAFGWLAFGWYSLPLEGEVTPPADLIGVGGSVRGTPVPGGLLSVQRPGGGLSVQGPGGSVVLKP